MPRGQSWSGDPLSTCSRGGDFTQAARTPPPCFQLCPGLCCTQPGDPTPQSASGVTALCLLVKAPQELFVERTGKTVKSGPERGRARGSSWGTARAAALDSSPRKQPDTSSSEDTQHLPRTPPLIFRTSSQSGFHILADTLRRTGGWSCS